MVQEIMKRIILSTIKLWILVLCMFFAAVIPAQCATESDYATYEVLADKVFVPTDNLNVRSGAGTSYEVLYVAPEGQELYLTGRESDNSSGSVWYEIVSPEHAESGWVNSNYGIVKGTDGSIVPMNENSEDLPQSDSLPSDGNGESASGFLKLLLPVMIILILVCFFILFRDRIKGSPGTEENVQDEFPDEEIQDKPLQKRFKLKYRVNPDQTVTLVLSDYDSAYDYAWQRKRNESGSTWITRKENVQEFTIGKTENARAGDSYRCAVLYHRQPVLITKEYIVREPEDLYPPQGTDQADR